MYPSEQMLKQWVASEDLSLSRNEELKMRQYPGLAGLTEWGLYQNLAAKFPPRAEVPMNPLDPERLVRGWLVAYRGEFEK
jgi:hypothetical protein